eukprot:sb/3461857/
MTTSDGVAMTTSASVTSGDEHTCRTVVSGIQESSKYGCFIESGDTSNEIQLNVIGLTFDAAAVTVTEGGEHSLVCAVTVPPTSTVILTWTKNNQEVGNRMQSTDNPSITQLIISSADLTDAGDYSCSATFLDVGTTTSQPATIRVLAFLRELSDVSVITGEDVTLECEGTLGTPSWSKDGDALAGITTTTLTLMSITATDGGVYECSVSVGGETITSTATLTVSDDGITQHPVSQTVQLGDSATFTCVAPSTSTYTWLLDGQETEGDISTLVVDVVSERAIVQCIAGTYHSQTAVLNVIGITSPPKSAVIGTAPNDTGKLACTAVGSDLLSITWVRDGVQEISGEDSSVGYVTYSTLKSGVVGSYQCSARYQGGIVVESPPATISTASIILEGHVVEPGADITLSCVITSTTPDYIYWTQNGAKIHTDNTFTTIMGETTSTLTLNTVTEESSYRCMAGSLTDLLVLQSDVAEVVLVGFVERPSDVAVANGGDGEITFSARLHDTNTVECDRGVLVSGGTENGVTEFTLTIGTVTDTALTVGCSILSGSGEEITRASALMITTDTPEITLSSSSRVLYGDTLTLSIAASFLTSPPSVHWAVNGVVTGSSSVTMATQNSLTSSLMWPVTRDMEVTATVHQYDLGVVTTATKTIIPYGVEMVSGPSTAHVGGSYNMTCVIRSDESVTVSWTKDGDQMTDDVVYHSGDRMYSVLPVVNMMTEDYGLYVCSAQFDDGATSAASHNLVQSQDCRVPEIENAVFPENQGAVVEHMGSLSIGCGEETVVIHCQYGSWNKHVFSCPVVSDNLMIQLVSGLVVVMVALIALGTAYICYRKNRAARSISPEPRTEQERPEATSAIPSYSLLPLINHNPKVRFKRLDLIFLEIKGRSVYLLKGDPEFPGISGHVV